MKILILGNGGREHAIAWKLNAFSHEVFIHPGNAGTIKEGFPSFGTLTSPKEIASVAKEKNIALIIIGPEQLLAEDYASTFRNLGFWVVGPGREAAKLETEATWLEVCRIDSPLERLAAARTLKPIKGHSSASSGCAERF